MKLEDYATTKEIADILGVSKASGRVNRLGLRILKEIAKIANLKGGDSIRFDLNKKTKLS